MLSDESDPYAAVVPYSTCDVEAGLVVQVMVAEFEVTPETATEVTLGMLGATFGFPPVQVRTVIE